MNRSDAPAGRSFRFLGAALIAALLAGAVGVPAAAAAPDAGVTAAEQRLRSTQQTVTDLTKALDDTAEQYEQANAHRIRLTDELADADVALEQADAAVLSAEERLTAEIATAYKHPRTELSIAGLLFDAPDAPSALHRAGMYERIAQQGAGRLDETRRATSLVATDVEQEKIIAAGAQASIDEWQRQSDALSKALESAKSEIGNAQAALTQAKEEAARRAEEKRRAEALLQIGAPPGGPPPSIDGRTCPIGGPNGFIDSWGFPRSGGRTHEGVDIFAAYGTPLYAVAEGYIYRVYNNPIGGLSINLIDTEGNMYYYTHLSSVSVTTGQDVHMGQVIGAVGQSGNAAGTPPHLHWQFHPGNGAPVNPYPLSYALCRG